MWFVAMNKWQDITDMEVSQGRQARYQTPGGSTLTTASTLPQVLWTSSRNTAANF